MTSKPTFFRAKAISSASLAGIERVGGYLGAVARDVFEPVEVDSLGDACDRDPVENFRASRLELALRQSLQEGAVLVGERLEDGAVEFLIHQEMAQASRRQHADPHIRRVRL